jgi:hypothetical protein
MVYVPDVEEPDIVVVDAFVVLPQLLALLEWDVPAVALPPGHATTCAGRVT